MHPQSQLFFLLDRGRIVQQASPGNGPLESRLSRTDHQTKLFQVDGYPTINQLLPNFSGFAQIHGAQTCYLHLWQHRCGPQK